MDKSIIELCLEYVLCQRLIIYKYIRYIVKNLQVDSLHFETVHIDIVEPTQP